MNFSLDLFIKSISQDKEAFVFLLLIQPIYTMLKFILENFIDLVTHWKFWKDYVDYLIVIVKKNLDAWSELLEELGGFKIFFVKK